MSIVGAVVSLAIIGWVLLEAFEAMVLPRRVMRKFRLNRWFYRVNWPVWQLLSRAFQSPKRRETFLSVFGPLSLLTLFIFWVLGLIAGFALLHWSLGTQLHTPAGRAEGLPQCLYFSGITFFTIGYGDLVPQDGPSRFLAIVEGGVGFGFLAIIIGYLPVLYQAFSRREVVISMLDARAGSPPSAGQLLLRVAPHLDAGAASDALAEWERWSAELLESQLSFPVLSYYRSQHDNQSWLAALTAILDSCALLLAGVRGDHAYQAQVTFAMARHAAVDLALVFHTPPIPPDPDRLPPERLGQLRQLLCEAGLPLGEDAAAGRRLAELRGMYEPFLNALAHHLLFTLPPVLPDKPAVDNWQTTAWARRAPGISSLPLPADGDDHFD